MLNQFKGPVAIFAIYDSPSSLVSIELLVQVQLVHFTVLKTKTQEVLILQGSAGVTPFFK